MRFAGFILLVFLHVGLLQAQERDASDRTRRGTLTGRVIAADTGRPIARAQVEAAVLDGAAEHVLTDDTGSFLFESLPAGRYALTAFKRGLYLDARYGRTHPDLPSTLVAVTGDRDTRIEIQMVRAAAIAGRVFDEAGDPLPFARLVLMPHQPPPGGPHLAGPALALRGALSFTMPQGPMTNDRGEYRLFGIQPGEYVLSATAPRMPGQTDRLAPIFYPGVIDPAAATVIQLSAGQEIANADFMMQSVPVVTVSGIVIGPENHPIGSGELALFSVASSTLSQVGTVRADGSFRFDAIPGHYVLRARYSAVASATDSSNRSLSVAQPLTIGTDGISDLVIRLTAGATMAGRMSFEGSSRPRDTAVFKIMVESGSFGRIETATHGPGNTFTLRAIESGARRIATMTPRGWFLKGIYINGRDMADTPVEFRDDTTITDVSVVFTDVTTQLTIAVEHSEPGTISTVMIFPNDPSFWHNRRLRSRTFTSEPIVISDLPPGDYLVAAIPNVNSNEVRVENSKLLERLRPIAQKVRLAEGTPASVRVRALPIPQ